MEWIEFVKTYAKKNKITYKQALTQAKDEYRKQKNKKQSETIPVKFVKTDEITKKKKNKGRGNKNVNTNTVNVYCNEGRAGYTATSPAPAISSYSAPPAPAQAPAPRPSAPAPPAPPAPVATKKKAPEIRPPPQGDKLMSELFDAIKKRRPAIAGSGLKKTVRRRRK